VPNISKSAWLTYGQGKSLELRTLGPTRLGRAPDNDLELTDSTVSQHHAEISFDNGRAFLRDLGSSNGTFIGGAKVSGGQLTDGSTIKLGRVELVYREAVGGEQSTRSADQSSGSHSETIHVPMMFSHPTAPSVQNEKNRQILLPLGGRTPLEEARLRNPAFTSETIQSEIRVGKDYAGCPHCKGASAFVCRCGKVAYRSRTWLRKLIPLLNIVTWPWCGRRVRTKTGKSATFHAGAD
jgi:pSer/pThr/pTyr-binding forkhead associated (FHA) protein